MNINYFQKKAAKCLGELFSINSKDIRFPKTEGGYMAYSSTSTVSPVLLFCEGVWSLTIKDRIEPIAIGEEDDFFSQIETLSTARKCVDFNDFKNETMKLFSELEIPVDKVCFANTDETYHAISLEEGIMLQIWWRRKTGTWAFASLGCPVKGSLADIRKGIFDQYHLK